MTVNRRQFTRAAVAAVAAGTLPAVSGEPVGFGGHDNKVACWQAAPAVLPCDGGFILVPWHEQFGNEHRIKGMKRVWIDETF